MRLNNVQLSNQEIKLTGDEVHALGPGLILTRCDVISDGDFNSLIVAGMTMVGGRFIQEAVLTNFHFAYAHFLGIKFSGSYSGCDFGDWDAVEKASIEECDFTDANLDGCRFLNCDVQTIKFPKWPGFTIINPAAALSHVSSFQWPERLGSLMFIYADNDPECSAICGDAERIAKKYGLGLDELRDLLVLVPGIQILD